jgi:starch synthase
MYIVLLAAECAPVAKAGGLGDFIQGLGRALQAAGAEVEVLLPDYDCLKRELIENYRQVRDDLLIRIAGESLRCRVSTGRAAGLNCRFLAPQSAQAWFERGCIYGQPDDALRFASYCRAALEYLAQSGRWPEILHCNDWQTGLIPVLLYEDYAARGANQTRVCYSLHNLGHQGWVAPELLQALDLDAERLMTPDRLRESPEGARANLMKGGIVFSNVVTTVSPRYAWEVLRTEQGRGLQETLATKAERFVGVLNGIDTDSWNPRQDPHIAAPFDAEDPAGKAVNCAALRQRLGLPPADKPVLAMVSRLDRQKGVALMQHALGYSLSLGAQVVLLGSAMEDRIQQDFEQLRDRLAGQADVHLELGYDETLAHQIYAGADLILVPSLYEPCGLTQLIAMRYGAVPIVRRVGGLADTVFDANFCDRPTAERNGFVFDDTTPDALEFALERAIGLWFQHPEQFRALSLNGMRTDVSWYDSAQRYWHMYAGMLNEEF